MLNLSWQSLFCCCCPHNVEKAVCFCSVGGESERGPWNRVTEATDG